MTRALPILRYPDPARALAGVGLVTELWKRATPRPYRRADDGWELELGELPVDRLEYQLELVHADGRREIVLDPAAPTVEAPFGPKSVVTTAGYHAPAWLSAAAPPGHDAPLELASPMLDAPVRGRLWTAAGLTPTTPAPLLVVHDGPELARFAALDHCLAVAIAAGTLPPLRAALLAPRDRNDDYAASDRYADALALDLVPALVHHAPLPDPRACAGLGASLGALAMLHAHRRHPGLFGALVLQSGSFFQRALDGQEAGFSRFARIEAFVREVVDAARWAPAIPVALTCGTGEENLANNRAMARALAAQGYPVTLDEVRDGHTWTGWRDTLAAALGSLGARWR